MTDLRRCARCGETKSTTEFHKRGTRFKSSCKPCRAEEKFSQPSYRRAKDAYLTRYANDPAFAQMRRDQERARRFGLTAEQVNEMLAAQGGVCAICKAPDSGREGYFWYIDHDHACCPKNARSCGKCVRGLLCVLCNTGLGSFRDNTESLKAAIKYLERQNG